MNRYESQINSTLSSIIYETPFTRKIKFIVFLILEPPALLCNFLLVYHLIVNRSHRNALHNHAILVLLIVTLLINSVEIPLLLHYLNTGFVAIPNHIFCILWQWFDYLLSSEVNLIMVWASFERHLLVFHINLFISANYRLYAHYLPLLVIIVYLILYHIAMIFLYPCTEEFEFDVILCGVPCYSYDVIISIYDLFAHHFLPVCFIALFSVGLIVRVLHVKRIRHHQHVQWRKHRKMILQILYISCLFLACIVPTTLVRFIELFGGLKDFADYVEMVYFFYLYWLLALLLPFACIGCAPEMVNQFKRLSHVWLHKNNLVEPNLTIQ